MSKEIKKREGFFKLFHKYNNDKSYRARKEELDKEDIKLEKKDGFALFLSALITIVVPVLLMLSLTLFLAFLFFRINPWG